MSRRRMLIVANEPNPENEKEYNQWYTEKHIPMMLKFKGMKKASRYRCLDDGQVLSKYLAIYEFDSQEDMVAFPQSPEFAEAVNDFDEKWKDGGFLSKWVASYELIKSWEK